MSVCLISISVHSAETPWPLGKSSLLKIIKSVTPWRRPVRPTYANTIVTRTPACLAPERPDSPTSSSAWSLLFTEVCSCHSVSSYYSSTLTLANIIFLFFQYYLILDISLCMFIFNSKLIITHYYHSFIHSCNYQTNIFHFNIYISSTSLSANVKKCFIFQYCLILDI